MGPTGAGPQQPSSRRANMQANRRRDTKPELQLRSALHAAGYRFRCDIRLQARGTWARPDIVFTRRRVAVFVDGCFWHSCPLHGSTPRTNSEYWTPKLDRNRNRDQAQTEALRAEGWTVLRIWEHEAPEDALARLIAALSS
ncbi:MAG TPA: very short patch repair endonuclease [Protaetiibacter sp.]|nr:very short patch repair endonuclease [Protaetiibacter sp.]